MSGSRMIQVRHRTGRVESFDSRKLSATLGRALAGSGPQEHSSALAQAVELFLRRRGISTVSSGALREMTLATLQGLGLDAQAERLAVGQPA